MLQVGFGSADITPAVGSNMPGGFFPVLSKGVRDPLIASACVLHDGSTTVALVGVDILTVSRPLVLDVRQRIERTNKIPANNVLINASHTHSGGPVPRFREPTDDSPYSKAVAQGIADAVAQAWNSLHAAELGIGTGRETGIVHNRRFRMRDGRTITHPGKPGTPHNAKIVEPEGPVDPAVGVLALRAPKGALMGVVVNFGCHSTVVGGDQFSPDYAVYLRKHLRAQFGPQLPVVFLLGACGDVTQVDNTAIGRESGPAHADLMGLKLAGEVARVVSRLEWKSAAPLAATVEPLDVALRPDPDVDRERPAYGLGASKDWEPVYATARAWLAETRVKRPTMPTEVQAIRIGPLAIVTNGSEFFASDGLRVKAASPLPNTWIATLTNDAIGYVPPASSFVAGGYEPRTGSASFLAIDTSQRLVEAMLKSVARFIP